MATSFHRVNGALRSDNGLHSVLSPLLALALLAAWVTWAFTAHLTRYEVADSARLEVLGAAYPVQSNMAGRVVSSHLILGHEVKAGDAILQLDNEDQLLALKQERVHLASLAPQLAALRARMQTEAAGRADERRVLDLSIAAARAQYREAQTQADLAAQDAGRAVRLHAEGILSDADMQRAKAEAQSRRAAADNLKVTIARLEPELTVRERDREVRQKQIQADTAKLEAEAAASAAAISRLEYEVERRCLRAPTSGRLGECAGIRPGSYITEGQQLGIILPSGKLQVVAAFTPSAALGKLRPGQPAIVRLQGFPWAQFGTLSARVTRVADDIRDGKVRVELAVISSASSHIPVQHGLPGSVEVEVEDLSPAALVLRSAGQAVGAP
ncbi:MAG: HlyD family efflux transporter periplasmic adaptor subunit [Acidobacteriaceae bacterium]|nr:HlyD family efflux transporter periplasmic adaptor subunit [Acidobacteriaceae bacterium]